MSADRKLLELAAKAAGIYGFWTEKHPEDGHPTYSCGIGPRCWNPLTDNGEAFRLAVDLRITPHIDANMTEAESIRGFSTEAHNGEPLAATRRAIVRAAAEIGAAK